MHSLFPGDGFFFGSSSGPLLLFYFDNVLGSLGGITWEEILDFDLLPLMSISFPLHSVSYPSSYFI